MTGSKPDILLIGPSKPRLAKGLEPVFTVHSLIEAKDREAFLSGIADRVQAFAVTYSNQKIDAAFMRVEPDFPELTFVPVAQEALIVLMPSDHRLTALDEIDPQALVGENFISGSRKAGVLRRVTEDFLKRSGVDITPTHGVDNIAVAITLVASTRGLSLMPAYAKNMLPWSVVSRPLKGEVPTIELALAYSKANASPILKLLLSKLGDLKAHAASKV